MVLDRDASGVEEHEYYHEPIEPLRLDDVPDPEAKPLLGPPESGTSSASFRPRLEVAASPEACQQNYFHYAVIFPA